MTPQQNHVSDREFILCGVPLLSTSHLTCTLLLDWKAFKRVGAVSKRNSKRKVEPRPPDLDPTPPLELTDWQDTVLLGYVFYWVEKKVIMK